MSLKQVARQIFEETLQKVDIRLAFASKVRPEGNLLHCGPECVDLSPFSSIRVISFGKAAWVSAEALLDRLRETPAGQNLPITGIIVSDVPVREAPPGFQAFRADYPYPDSESLLAAHAILEMLEEVDENTVVFFLVSGGGTALVEEPLAPMRLADVIEVNEVLAASDASPIEIHPIRTHLSAVKGLAEAARPAHQVTLILSDEPETQPHAVASGPTLPDRTTVEDCYRLVKRYDLLRSFPPLMRNMFQENRLQETPSPGDDAFARSQGTVLLSNHDVVEAARASAENHGFRAVTELSCDEAHLQVAATILLERLSQLPGRDGNGICVISGGEVRSRVIGEGKGGRNQAFVLHVVRRISGTPCVVLSANTSGIDGNSPAAGAVADGQTLTRASTRGLDPDLHFRESDSHAFFKALDDTIMTGPRQNTLRDLRLLIIPKQ